MKGIQKRMLVQIVLGFMLGRAEVFGICGLGVGYYAAGTLHKGAKLPVGISVLLGMYSIGMRESLFEYMLVMLAVGLFTDFLQQRSIVVGIGQLQIMLGAVFAVIKGIQWYFVPWDTTKMWMEIMEVIVVVSGTAIYSHALSFLLKESRIQSAEGTGFLTVSVLAGTAVLGISDITIGNIMPLQIIVYAFTVICGYYGGAGDGAISGMICGSLLLISRQHFSEIGMLAFIGLTAGLLNTQKKILCAVGCAMTGICLLFYQGTALSDAEALWEVAAGMAFFFFLPSGWVHQRMPRQKEEEQQMQGSVMHKLKDFSKIFDGLSNYLVKKSSFIGQEEMYQEVRLATDGQVTDFSAGMRNQMCQSRQIIAQQMKEVGIIVEEMAKKLPVAKTVSEEVQRSLRRQFWKKRVSVHKMNFYEKYDGRLEIHLSASTRYGSFVTTKEVSDLLSKCFGCKILVKEDCRRVFPKESADYVFEECVRLKALTGISRIAKEGEELSGDTFSCVYLPEGELLVALSDGMGSGENAFSESEQVIEFLEKMAEAGFSENLAIQLINSIYTAREDNQGFATADIAVLDLYGGNCRLTKCGAGTSYVGQDKTVKEIRGEALPVGVVQQMEPFCTKVNISSGDYVIMMTDGVSDCFAEEEGELLAFIQEKTRRKLTPQDLAEQILEKAMERYEGIAGDDMSVMVVKIYGDAA